MKFRRLTLENKARTIIIRILRICCSFSLLAMVLLMPANGWCNHFFRVHTVKGDIHQKMYSSNGPAILATVVDGLSKVEAEKCDTLGPVCLSNTNGVLTYKADHPWALYQNVDLHTGASYLQLRIANGGDGSEIQVWANGTITDTFSIGNTGSWDAFQTMTFKLNHSLSGLENIKYVFTKGRVNLDWFMFLAAAPSRLRVVISSDFPPLDVCMNGCAADHTSDPDDVQSMIRFLLYANEFDIEGLVASSGTFANVANKAGIRDIINLYDKVDENLRVHDSHYPGADYLHSVTFQGLSGTWGGTVSNNIGSDKDSEASEAIIRIIDKPDPRPVWFCFWGDCSNLAQAIWKVQQTRSGSELKLFLSKIRIYQIAHQDNTIDWLMNNFPDLFFIYSNTTYMGIFGGSNDPTGNLSWLNTNIRENHGPLGAVYPPAAMGVDGLKEGDSPSFMYLVSAVHGINDPENPAQESWGGQYIRSGSTNHWIDGPGPNSISKWKSQYQAEFAKRADWMLLPTKVNMEKKYGLSIFPNPANDKVTVCYQPGFDELNIYSNCGEKIYEAKFDKTSSYIIPVTTFIDGLYIFEVKAAHSTVCSKIIVQQNAGN